MDKLTVIVKMFDRKKGRPFRINPEKVNHIWSIFFYDYGAPRGGVDIDRSLTDFTQITVHFFFFAKNEHT